MTVPKSAVAGECECGCGARTTPGRRFRAGHNSYSRRRVIEVVRGVETLYCPRCEQRKPFDGFPRKGVFRNGDQRYGYCKECHSAYQRTHKLKREFGMTDADYEARLAAQGGCCAICHKPPKKNRLAIDHCHATGVIRGLLCTGCNGTLGRWGDNADRFERAAAYLRRV